MVFDPKTWADGELITAADLNRVEQAVDAVDEQMGSKVDATDPRLSDARPPTTHTHPITDVDGLQAALDSKTSNAAISRNIASMFPTEVALLSARVARVGPVVNLSFGARFPEAPSSNTIQMLILPTGFRPTDSQFALWDAASTSGRTSGRVLLTSGGVLTSYASVTQPSWGYWSVTYLTTDPWPTVLPGEPA